MRLKYRTGYFLSFVIAIIGVILMMGGFDDQKYVLLAGFLGIAMFGIFYFIEDFSKQYTWREWGNLLGCVLILILLCIHFILLVKVDYFLFASMFIIRPYLKNTEVQIKSGLR
jgi:hypothetical protein